MNHVIRIKMKRHTPYYIYVLMMCFISCFPSCDDKLVGENDYLEPSLSARYLHCLESLLSFPYTASSKDFRLEAVNTPWRISGMDDWLTLSPTSGSNSVTLSASVSENFSSDLVRSCVLTLQSEVADYTYKKNIEVTQIMATPYMNLSETSLELAAKGESKTVTVATNLSFDITCSESWLQYAISDDRKTLTITATANPTTSVRTATVYLNGTLTKTVTVMQEGSGLTVSQTTPIVVGREGGRVNMRIESDAPWIASYSSYSWLSVTPEQGDAGTSDIVLEVSPNASASGRTGYVQFMIGSSSVVQVKVEQAGIYLNVSPSAVSFDADACSRDIEVGSNMEWKVLAKPDWVSASPENSKGDATLTLRAADNSLTASRSGVVTIGIEGLSIQQDITVSQKGRTFDNLIASLQFEAKSGSQTVTVTTDGSWTATSNQSWLTLSPASGKGTATVTATASENTTDQPREALVTVKVGNTEKTILVTQAAHYLTLAPTQFNALPSTGGSHQLTIASDDSWTASKKAAWLSVSPSSGTGTIEVTATAADNPSVNARKDTVAITPSYAIPVRAVILQDARYLKVDTRDIYFYYRGGTSDPVTVDTDGSYSVTASDTWLTIRQNGKTFTVTATENTTADKREGKVVVSLTGLVAGESKTIEIPVVQRVKSQGPGKDGFSPDEDWSVVGGSSAFKVTVTGYDDDSDWNKLIR